MIDARTIRNLSWVRKATTIAAGIFALQFLAMTASAAESFETPTLEHVLTVRANIDAPLSMGKTPQGERRVIVITGGTFEGPGMKGTIMPGGEDWQLLREDGVTELDARYWLRTDDGAVIRVHNQVLLGPAAETGANRYARSTVRFEAPIGKYDWLNKAVFVGTLSVESAQRPVVVTLRFFKVN
ncbi:MAG TPA: DUF3237 domain-containing protein [Steroidobacteraceae bacterium]